VFQKDGKNEDLDYGAVCKMGDRIGMLLEFNNDGLDVSFFLNGADLGVAFSKLKKNKYIPCVVMLYEGTKVKISNDISFPIV
jgi:hypothetical protein